MLAKLSQSEIASPEWEFNNTLEIKCVSTNLMWVPNFARKKFRFVTTSSRVGRRSIRSLIYGPLPPLSTSLIPLPNSYTLIVSFLDPLVA